MSTKLKKIGQQRKDLIYKQIKKLHDYHASLMECYMNTVLPYGLGYDMPDDVRSHATKLAEQAARVRVKMQKLEKQVGIIVPQRIPEPNAKPVNLEELKALLKKIEDERSDK